MRSSLLGTGLAVIVAVIVVMASLDSVTAQVPQGASSSIQLAQAPDEAPPRRPTPAKSAAATAEAVAAARANAWTVGIAGGLLEGTFIRFAAELAKVLDDGDNLRILPMVTYGAAENLTDLLYLKGVDVAITHADALEDFRRRRGVSDIQRRVTYISELYISELHILARPEIRSLKDLEGRKVGFHTRGAAPSVTGPIVFERLGIKVEPVYVNNAIAYEMMRAGELAALLHVVGKPNDLFVKLKPEPGFHFLPVTFVDQLADTYVPSALTADDYPGFIPAGTRVETIGVPALLAVYNWPQGSDRHRRVERFIEYYVARFATLRQPSFHPKWREVNLESRIPGWTRYWAVDQVLARAPARASAPAAATPASAPAALGTTAPATATRVESATSRPAVPRPTGGADAEQEQLFQQFLEWSKAQKR